MNRKEIQKASSQNCVHVHVCVCVCVCVYVYNNIHQIWVKPAPHIELTTYSHVLMHEVSQVFVSNGGPQLYL